MYVRDAFQKLYEMFKPYAKKCLIIVGHIRTASINKDGKELQASDLDLPGKLRQMVCSDADAIGFLHRNKNNPQNILSFKTSEQDLATGARPDHLKMQEFVISEMIDGKLITYWDKIFID